MATDTVAKHGVAAAVADNAIQVRIDADALAELVAFCLLPPQRSINGATPDVNGGRYVR